MALLIATTIGYKLAISYQEEGLIGGVVGLISAVLMLPAQTTLADLEGNSVTAGGVLTQTQTSATGMFLAMILCIIVGYLTLQILKNGKIKNSDA